MQNSTVENQYYQYTKSHEGYTPFPYCDTLNLVTTGIGNLADASAPNTFDISPKAYEPFLKLPWRHKGPGWTYQNPVVGVPLSTQEMIDAFTTTKLKASPDFAFNKKGGFAYASLTDATLSDADMNSLFLNTMHSFENVIIKNYPNYPVAPADAQCAIMTMAWAMGPNFKFTAFQTAFISNDFAKAATLCFFKGGGGTLEKPTGINANNILMFQNADIVQKAGTGFGQLFFPGKANPSSAIIPTSLVPKIPFTSAQVEKTGLILASGAASSIAGYYAWKWWKERK